MSAARTTRTASTITAEDRLAALQARRQATVTKGRHKHAAHGARVFTAVAAASSVFGLAGVMAMANTTSATATSTGTASATALKSVSQTATGASAAAPTTVASTSSHGS